MKNPIWKFNLKIGKKKSTKKWNLWNDGWKINKVKKSVVRLREQVELRVNWKGIWNVTENIDAVYSDNRITIFTLQQAKGNLNKTEKTGAKTTTAW